MKTIATASPLPLTLAILVALLSLAGTSPCPAQESDDAPNPHINPQTMQQPGAPFTPTYQSYHHMNRHLVLRRAEPRRLADARTLSDIAMAAESFYHTFEAGSGSSQANGFNLEARIGNKQQAQVVIPLHFNNIRHHTGGLNTIGVDGRYVLHRNEHIVLGTHLSYLNLVDWDTDYGTQDSVKNRYNIGGGGFAGVAVPLGDRTTASAGMIAGYTKPQEDDGTFVVTLAGNLGIQIIERLAVNVYAIGFQDLNAPGERDDNYLDVGTDLECTLGGTWSMRGGFKTTLAYEDQYDSTGVFLSVHLTF